MKGREFMQTIEYREKMSLLMKGKQNSLGTKQSKKTIAKRVRWFQGEKHWGWKGGKSWGYSKKQTLLRDNYTCQSCGLREPEIMEVDHVLSKSLYPGLRFDLSNLMTLCPNCHRRKTLRDVKNKAIKFKAKKITLLEA